MALTAVRNTTAPWYQGNSGATNFSRGEAQAFAKRLLNSQTYRDSLEERIKNKTLAPGIEQMLWHYAYGKPIEQVNVTVQPGQVDLSALSVDELLAQAQKLEEALKEAAELEAAIPTQYKVQP